jgi:hypothetical protein
MPSAFADLARVYLQPAFALHAQTFIWSPMKAADDVNAPPVADYFRPGGQIRGAFFDKSDHRKMPNVYDPRADQRPGQFTDKPRIEFGPPIGGPPPAVQMLDLLTDEAGSVWSVVDVYISKVGILVAAVNSVS